MTIKTFFINIFIILLSITGNAQNTDVNRKLLFLGNENIPPVVYNVDNTPKGIVVDLSEAIAKEAGLNIKVDVINWEKAQEMLRNGKADALLQINKNSEREKYLDFSLPLLKSEFCVFTASIRKDITCIDSLKNKVVGVENNGYPFLLLKKYPDITVRIIPDFKTGFEMIKNEKLDALIVDRWVGEYQLAINRIGGISTILPPIAESYSSIAVKKGNKALLDRINYGLSKIKTNGVEKRILKKWKGKEIIHLTKREVMLYRYSIILGAFCLILFIIVLIYAFKLIISTKKLKQANHKLFNHKKELEEIKQKLEKQNRFLEKIANVDHLTNLYNRRFFKKTITNKLKKAKKNKQSLSLLMIDIDFFKDYNDRFGHIEGDKALKKVAFAIKKSIKQPYNIVARYGGEEFIVLLPDTTIKCAETIGEKIRIAILDLKIKSAQQSIKEYLSISIGIAEVSTINTDNLENIGAELTVNADKALLEAKRQGRNRTVLFLPK